jgi:hypothetical protein
MGSQHPAETRETDDDEAVFCCDLDGEIHKLFPIREHHTFQFGWRRSMRAITRTGGCRTGTSFREPRGPGLPSTAADANFGVVTSTAGAMRQLQLGLKHSF